MRSEIINARLDLDGPLVAIGINCGQITHVGDRQGWPVALDAKEDLALPGDVDGHVHDRDDGSADSPKETRWTAQAAAIRGGVTTTVAQANTTRTITSIERLVSKLEALREAKITCLQWYGATPYNSKTFAQAATIVGCVGVKMCTANTTATGEMLVDKPEDQYEICARAAEHDFLVDVHSEKEAMIKKSERRLRNQGIALNLSHHCEIRHWEAEWEQTCEILEIARKTGCKVNIAHVSAPETLEEILWAAETGVRVTFEFCPQYCFFSSEDLARSDGWRVKCNPSVRSPEQRDKMLAYLCDETIKAGMLATDHAPHNPKEDKMGEGYGGVASGMPGLETALPLCLDLVNQGKMSLDRLRYLTAEKPAETLGLQHKGHIAAGFDADIVVIDMKATWTIDDADVVTQCGWTPFHGQTVQGIPKATIAAGKVLMNRF
ncbi:MAG: dihydroorotase family protein [Candidatus Andersenbacteria bacterium]